MTRTMTPKPKAQRTSRRFLVGVIQVGLLAFSIFLGTLWIIVGRAEARLHDAAERFLPAALGSEHDGSSAQKAPFEGTLFLNGLPLLIETRNLPGSPPEQVPLLEKQCRGFSFDAEVTKGLGRTVVCLRVPEGKSPELTAGLRRYAETSDLSELGAPEVYFLRPAERAAQPFTQLLKVSARSLALASAFLPLGDAPGLDPRFAPRPDGRRLLSVQFHESSGPKPDAPPEIREVMYAYESPEAPERSLQNYERTLLRTGFRAVPTGTQGDSARAFESDTDTFIVMVGPKEKGSWLSLALLPTTGASGPTLVRN